MDPWAGSGAAGATMAQYVFRNFFAISAFFYPGRFDARGDYLGPRQSHGRAFEVITVTPWGGHPRDLWFDRRTHLLGRIVDRTGDGFMAAFNREDA